MTAVDRNLLENELLQTETRNLVGRNLMSELQQQKVVENLKVPQINRNYWLRILFFGLGLFAYGSSSGLLTTLTLEVFPGNYEIVLLIGGLIGVVCTELLCRSGYYRQGLDDAFLLSAQCQLIFGFGIITENVLLTSIAAFFIGLIFFFRYVNSLSGLIAIVGFTAIFVALIMEYKILPVATLPFVMFLVSMMIYAVYSSFYLSDQSLIYRNRMYLIKIFSLLLFYFSVNYLVVRELSESLLNVVLKPGEDISFSWVFYILTFLIPIAFVIVGVKMRDRMMLYAGMLTFAFSVFTIRFYYEFMPVETLVLICGLMLLGAAYFSIMKIRHRVSGLSFLPDNSDDNESLMVAQAIIANSVTSQEQPATADSPIKFGGGGFSGGGAGESF
ncbi:MAG: hypothetical protein IR153_03760 [Flavobacterium sp.]|nr:hypothetical protein [Flavobacterium sp.]